MPHIHAGAIEAVAFAATLVIVGALWRTVSARLAERPIGQAMAFIY